MTRYMREGPRSMTQAQHATDGAQSFGAAIPASELEFVTALRRGDEAAFALLLDRYQGAMVRIARIYVGSHAVAEEVVQDAWLGVLQGLDRFESRSSLKTWIFRILTNRAKTRGEREGRYVSFSALADRDDARHAPAVEPDRFLPANHEKWPGHWASPPRSWDDVPESRLLAQETREQIMAAIEALPVNQRMVITMRDVEGWSAEEVCQFLGISETNQRVLLHRARSSVRRALEQYINRA
jgi:RNA polymerase sigma-70 factor, ECF subfamily